MRRQNWRPVSLALLLLGIRSELYAVSGKPSDEIQILKDSPRNARIDGELKEWGSPATLSLNAAKIWIALNTSGLSIAGHVENASLSTAKVELWLSLPSPEMPPIATFGKKNYELIEMDSTSHFRIDDSERQELTERDKIWINLQKQRRNILEKTFTRNYILTAKGIEEKYWSAVSTQSIVDYFPEYEAIPAKDYTHMTYEFLSASTEALVSARVAFRSDKKKRDR